MDVFLTVLGFVFVCLGIVGSFLPILPGPITSWVGLLLIQLTSPIAENWMYLGVTLFVAVFIFILDYFIPAIGAKKFGGSKYGAYGTTIGLIVGLLSPIPFGIVIGAFSGALVGELLYDSEDVNRALKASFGAFIGFLTSTFIKFSTAVLYFILFIMDLITIL